MIVWPTKADKGGNQSGNWHSLCGECDCGNEREKEEENELNTAPIALIALHFDANQWRYLDWRINYQADVCTCTHTQTDTQH